MKDLFGRTDAGSFRGSRSYPIGTWRTQLRAGNPPRPGRRSEGRDTLAAEGKGTKFTIILPVVVVDPKAKPAAAD